MQKAQGWSVYVGALGIALVAAAFLLGLVTNTRRDALLLLGALGIVLIAFYVLTRPRDKARQTSTMRTASQGVNVFIVALAFIGIIAAVNFIAARQFNQRWDVTASGQHTLSQQTVQVLQNLQEPIKVTGFFTPLTQADRAEAETMLKDYQAKTDKLQVQMVDPDENPTLAQKYDNAAPGTLVFEKGDRTEKVYNYDENTFTNAILKVSQTKQPVIYFTTGHGEYRIDDFDVGGMGAMADFLKQVNYKVQPLNLATISGTLPADTSALVIAGPTKAFSPESAKTVQDYLDSGGRVLIMADAGGDIGLGGLLKEWGLTLDQDLILDPAQNYRGNLPIPVFLKFPDTPITQNLESLGVFLPGSSSITKAEKSDKDLTAFLTTTDGACAKTDFSKLRQQTAPECEDGDKKGAYVIGYSAEGAGKGGAGGDQRARLIVLGNAAFATNRWMNSQDSLGNQQLFANMIYWLAGQEELIAIPPRDPDLRPLTALTGNEVNLVALTSVLLIPLGLLLVAGLLWWRRR